LIAQEIHRYIKDFSLEAQHDLFSEQRNYVTSIEHKKINGFEFPQYINEFWTSKQRQSSSIHEISYRACFKAQLPRFFINLLTSENDVVYDPFSGRGTTVIEAAILGRNIIANDINPLSEILSYPRINIPDLSEVKERLSKIEINKNNKADIDLSMFYHPDTEAEIVSIQKYLSSKIQNGTEDDVDKWIRMVATNRLTGHSAGFFSVYTLPPNQALSAGKQIAINEKRNQIPEYRDTKLLILRKSKSLLRNLMKEERENINRIKDSALFLCKDARETNEIENNSIQLTVTSPPFLDVVQYSDDNWLRCWFNGISHGEISKKIIMEKTVDGWSKVMQDVFHELYRITKIGGWVAFEVGEVRGGKIKLEDYIIPVGLNSGFNCIGVLINFQTFTKTSNIWGIKNNSKGTNTNRIRVIIWFPKFYNLMNEKYLQNLESVIKQMLQPLKNIPLNLVIESISGYSIEPSGF